jgi:exonuclease VII small subunit
MKRHRQQAKQLYNALKDRGQTWTQSAATLKEWAEAFADLEDDVEDRKRIQRVLDWYCSTGIGALFVPMAYTAQAFRTKFEQIDHARIRSKTQTLRYFDDFLDYEINERRSGTETQKECNRVLQKVQQQVEFVDALAHKRVKLPTAKSARSRVVRKNTRTNQDPILTVVPTAPSGHDSPALTNGHPNARNGYAGPAAVRSKPPRLSPVAKRLTAKQQRILKTLQAVDKDILWQLLPNVEEQFYNHVKNAGWLKTFDKWLLQNRKKAAS